MAQQLNNKFLQQAVNDIVQPKPNKEVLPYNSFIACMLEMVTFYDQIIFIH